MWRKKGKKDSSWSKASKLIAKTKEMALLLQYFLQGLYVRIHIQHFNKSHYNPFLSFIIILLSFLISQVDVIINFFYFRTVFSAFYICSHQSNVASSKINNKIEWLVFFFLFFLSFSFHTVMVPMQNTIKRLGTMWALWSLKRRTPECENRCAQSRHLQSSWSTDRD